MRTLARKTRKARIPRGERFLNHVEKAGNKLPHPFILFIYIAVAIALASWIASFFDASVIDPETSEEVAVKSLISAEGVTYALSSMLDNFLSFPPLGLVIVMLLGVGLANQTGLLEIVFKAVVLRAHPRILTFVVVLVGIISNVASESAAIVIPPLAAMLFMAVGRHPIAGLAAGFGSVGAGFSANFIIAGTDVLLAGISTSAAQIVDSTVEVSPLSNWYFMSASPLVLAVVGVIITEKVVEPRLGKYTDDDTVREEFSVDPLQKKGLRNAGIAALTFIALFALLIVPPNAPMRGEDGGIVDSPFIQSIVPILFLFFVVVAVVYGRTTGSITTNGDIPKLMIESAKELSGIIVLIFAVAQSIAYFDWTNLGLLIAVGGADVLENLKVSGVVALIAVSLAAFALSIIISSGSALWAVMSPVFVPMLMLHNINPAFVQLAYRIADSSTNMLSPLSAVFAVAIGYLQKYDKKAGPGTIFALMIPYTV